MVVYFSTTNVHLLAEGREKKIEKGGFEIQRNLRKRTLGFCLILIHNTWKYYYPPNKGHSE